jgi:tetratricopeptide (TPR) repeat protein
MNPSNRILLGWIAILLAVGTGALCSQTQDAAAKFRLAQTFEQSGEYERAAQLYQELLRKEPGNILFLDGFQRTLVQLKRYDEAVQLLQQRLAVAPRDLNLRTSLAGVYQRAGREREARQEWENILAVDPSNVNLYRIVASSMVEYRLMEQAAEVYRRGRVACKDPMLFTIELAQLRIAMMDYEGASGELVNWLLGNPAQMSFVQSRLASFVGKPDGRSAAVKVVEEVLRDHRDVHLYELLSWLLLEGKEFDRALELTRTIDGLTHAQGGALLGFADRVFKERAFATALKAYQEALHVPLSPQRVPAALYGYANTLREMAFLGDTVQEPIGPASVAAVKMVGRYQECLEAYRQIIRNHPHTEFSAKAYYQIGLLQFTRMFDLDGALASFGHVEEEAGSVRVKRYDVALKIGQIYVAKGDTVGARRQFAPVVHAPGATPDQQDEAQFHLAEIAFFGGRSDEAIARLDSITVNLKADYANDALQLQSLLLENASPGVALAQFGRAEFLARQKKNTEAVALLQSIVKQFPTSLLVDDALMRAAELQEEAGLAADALATYGELMTQFKEASIALDRAQFNVAETYQFSLRDKEKAIAGYEKLLADYPQSVFGALARKRIRLLRGDPL